MLVGLCISVVPRELYLPGAIIFFPLYLFTEWRIIKKKKQPTLVPIRAGIVAVVVIAAHYAPFKYEDRVINTSLAEYKANEKVALLFDADQLLFFYFPADITRQQLALPEQTLTLRELVKHIEQVTGLNSSIGYCGTGVSILWGASPVGGVRFYRAR